MAPIPPGELGPTGGCAPIAVDDGRSHDPRDDGLTLDRLAPGEPVQVLALRDWSNAGSVREPHRHDYHELLWIGAGSGHHLLDGERIPVRPGTAMLIGRGQVHVFEEARDVTAIALRFREEVVLDDTPGWLLAGRGGRTVSVPATEGARLEELAAMLAAETRRPPDRRSAELERHLVSVALLWFERWYDAMRTERRDADDAEVQLQRRFATLLEGDFAAHHDAAHYADALAVPAAALSRALSRVTGRATKELILDRVMLEAARLLRYSDLTIGEIAHRVGFGDQLYFSRAFKRRFDLAPMAYRHEARGEGSGMSMDA
ncbi:MAG: transcriptional regulator, AraC family [Solirubrobacterales bacterium]|nr:transcriptional regulator, AraC family [Solirubrobacterales bacterium]